jgi:gliding-associated putative ABC transporter substrate-binding component GldG
MKDKTKPRGQFDINSATTLLLVAGIVIILNLVSLNIFRRLDLTEGHLFSLSKASKETVRNLDDKLVVKAYFSEDLPSPYNNQSRYLRDQLDEYKAYSKGKFQYEFIDPGSEEKLEREAQSYRIPPLQVNVVANDKIEIKQVYMGLVMLYEDKSEVMPVIKSVQGLEYDLTAAIKRITSEELMTVGFLTGHEEPEMTTDLNTVTGSLQRQYTLTQVDLSAGNTIPDEIAVLVIVSPQIPLSDWEKYAIDQYIMKGGKVVFLIDKVKADISTSTAEPLTLELDDWLKSYGFTIQDNLVFDAQNTPINLTRRQGFITITNQVNYPFFPKVTQFNRTNAIVRDLENISLYFASSLDTSAAAAQGLEIEPLAFTSAQAGIQRGRFDINPLQTTRNVPYNQSHLILAAAIKGTFKSYFSDKEIPRAEGSTEFVPDKLTESIDNRMVVVGDGDFVKDDYRMNQSTATFFLNIVDWLAQDEDLIAIRSRSITDRPLKEISPGSRKAVKYANVLGTPLLVIVAGLIHWRMRRSRKKGVLR